MQRLFEGDVYCKPCNNYCEFIVSLNNFLRASTKNNLFAKVTGSWTSCTGKILFRRRTEGSREIALRLRELSVLPPSKAI